MARPDPANAARFWQAPALPGLSLLAADFTRHDYAPHYHDALVVAVTEAGGSEFRSRGRVEEARPAAVLVFNPTEPHSGRMARSPRWRYRSFYLEAAGLDALDAALGVGRRSYFTQNLIQDADLAERFLAAHRAQEEGDGLFGQQALLRAFGALAGRHASAAARPLPVPKDRRLLDRAVALMRARYAEPLSLPAIGTAVGLTSFQLIGLFKRTSGLTPHARLTQIRLEAALRLLKAGQPTAEAATAAGFYDQSAFNRHFKRAYGITPLQYLGAIR